MNFLELVNRGRTEGGVSGPALVSLGGTLSRQAEDMKNRINEGWMELQRRHAQWDFMRKAFSFDTTIAQQTYTPTGTPPVGAGLADFKNWKRDTFRIWTTSIGPADEQILGFLDYPTFRNLYQYASMRTTYQRPAVYTIAPNKDILLGAAPNAVFTVSGEYFKKPEPMVAETDEPGLLPDDYHMLIVWFALMNHGEFEAAPEVIRRAERNKARMVAELEADQLPGVTFGAPLA